jgi:hypothetical protein
MGSKSKGSTEGKDNNFKPEIDISSDDEDEKGNCLERFKLRL